MKCIGNKKILYLSNPSGVIVKSLLLQGFDKDDSGTSKCRKPKISIGIVTNTNKVKNNNSEHKAPKPSKT